MDEPNLTQAILIRPDEAVAPPSQLHLDTSNSNNKPPVEHALSLDATLSTADSIGIPPREENIISKRFIDLHEERADEDIQAVLASPVTPTHHAVEAPKTPIQLQKPEQEVLKGTEDAWRSEHELEASIAREQDVSAAFAGLPRVRPHWTHNYMKILVVGDDGLGKTTFIRNLFAAYASDVNRFTVSDASVDGADSIFKDTPERFCTELAVQDDESMVCWHYSVQDTPGYGDFDGSRDAKVQRCAILDYIRQCSERYLDSEFDPGRRQTMQQSPDIRVDVCLYFIPPHRLRRIDVKFMKELAALIPVIPILAKADSMTPHELQLHKTNVRNTVNRHIKTSSGGWKFSDDALLAAGTGASQGPPYAIVSAATLDTRVGRFWPVRRYPWGACQTMLTKHSELPILRRLLFEHGYWELKQNTERSYLVFRRRSCHDRTHQYGPSFLRFIMNTAVFTVGFVFVAVNLAPIIKSRAIRHETVRRVKGKVGNVVEGVVDGAIETAQNVQGKADSAVKTARGIGTQVTKDVRSTFETPLVRELREREEQGRVSKGRRRWWRFWTRKA